MITSEQRPEDFIQNWLENTSCESSDLSILTVEPLTPASSLQSPVFSQSPVDRKRKRKMPQPRSQSPQKRQRTNRDDDEVLPEQSASEVCLTELSERTRLSHPSRSAVLSPKRATSPVRDLVNDLRASDPSILCELPFTTELPESALKLQRSLMDGLEEGIIPGSLKTRLLASFPYAAETIPSSAYDFSDTRSEHELSALWEGVEDILNESRDCGRYQQDENAWCMKVVHPTLRLALKGSMLKVESVQSQAIDSELLPTMPKNYRIQKKADYAFSFHRNTPHVSELYNKLSLAGVGDSISQTIDANTKWLALFSGMEVKPENGGKDEALVQLATWLAAGLENLRKLGDSSQKMRYSCDKLRPVVGWTVIGHDWHTHIAYRTSHNGRDTLYVVGPWRAAAADTRDVYGVFKLLSLVKRAAEYASKVYWPWLREDILEPLLE